jgi:hypothetical protein
MAWVATAVIGGAVIGAYSTNKATKAQQQAGEQANQTTRDTEEKRLAFEQKQADQARSDIEPWRIAGGNALTRLSAGTAPGGDLMRNFGMSDFEQDPGYQFRLAEGMKGMTNSAAARGGLLSGAALKAAGSYNQGMASQEYGNAFTRFNSNRDGQYNKLASLANVGQVAANQNGNNAMQLGQSGGAAMGQSGNAISQTQMGVGNARASGYLAQGNALTGAINQGVSMWGQANAVPRYGASNITPGSWSA